MIINMKCKIKQGVDAFRSENGNTKISQQDLVMYLVHKIDNIDERFDKKLNEVAVKLDSTNDSFISHIKECSSNYLTKNTFTTMYSSLITALLVVLGYMLNKLGVI